MRNLWGRRLGERREIAAALEDARVLELPGVEQVCTGWSPCLEKRVEEFLSVLQEVRKGLVAAQLQPTYCHDGQLCCSIASQTPFPGAPSLGNTKFAALQS